MYSIQRVENSKPARYKVMFGSLPFSRAMTKRDAQEYLYALENNIPLAGAWKGLNSGCHSYYEHGQRVNQ